MKLEKVIRELQRRGIIFENGSRKRKKIHFASTVTSKNWDDYRDKVKKSANDWIRDISDVLNSPEVREIENLKSHIDQLPDLVGMDLKWFCAAVNTMRSKCRGGFSRTKFSRLKNPKAIKKTFHHRFDSDYEFWNKNKARISSTMGKIISKIDGIYKKPAWNILKEEKSWWSFMPWAKRYDELAKMLYNFNLGTERLFSLRNSGTWKT